MKEINEYYLNKKEPAKSCLLTLRNLILKMDTSVSETKKYGMPCFCFKNKVFCYLWMDKISDEPYILFVEGKHLDHPKLESGNRAKMKIFRINPTTDLPIDTIQMLLSEALSIYKKGIIKV